MEYCSKCGISGDRTILYEAISSEGIKAFCRTCLKDEKLPILGRMKAPREESPRMSVRERLLRLSNQGTQKSRNEDFSGSKAPNPELEAQNEMLRSVVERNLREGIIGEAKNNVELMDNFHWILMRARRRKCLTRSQLSEKIKEPESAIAALEKGLIPPNSERLINKLENYLSVNVRKRKRGENEIEMLKEKIVKEGVEFDELTTKTLTIEDLRELKEKQKEFE